MRFSSPPSASQAPRRSAPCAPSDRLPTWRVFVVPGNLDPAPLIKLGFRREGAHWAAAAWTKKQFDFLIDRCKGAGFHGRGIRMTEAEIRGMAWIEHQRREALVRDIETRRETRSSAKAAKVAAELERQRIETAKRDALRRADRIGRAIIPGA